MRKRLKTSRRGFALWACRAPVAVVWLWVVLCLVPLAASRADSVSELEVRAVYLYNFSVFVHWPDSAFETPDSDFRYCVLGNRELVNTLGEVLSEESAQGRPLRLLGADSPEDWRRCHLLYLDKSVRDLVPQVLSAVRGAPVLTVGDSDTFVHGGGMAALMRKGRRIKPAINRDLAEAVGIRISSKLLRLSTLLLEQGQ